VDDPVFTCDFILPPSSFILFLDAPTKGLVAQFLYLQKSRL